MLLANTTQTGALPLTLMLIDCHAHLDSFTNEEVSEILPRGRDVGVGFVISAGTTLASTQRSLDLSKVFPDFFSGVGIHPMDIEEPFDDSTYERLRDMALSTDKVLVVSEIGLDFNCNVPNFKNQEAKVKLSVTSPDGDQADSFFDVLMELE